MELEKIELRLQQLQRRLEDVYEKRKWAKQEQDSLEDGIGETQRKLNEVQEKIQGIIGTLQSKVERLSERSRFKDAYFTRVSQLLSGEKYSQLFNPMKETERSATKRFLELDDAVENYNREIRSLEDEITVLRQQINSIGGEK